MNDIRLTHDENGVFDLALAEGDLLGDDGLQTAVTISLFTDAPARRDDRLPDAGPTSTGDRRGWWGDALDDIAAFDPIGSRLWLLSREKEILEDMDKVIPRARQYAEESLAWLTRDGHVASVIVSVTVPQPSVLAIGVQTTRPGTGAGERTDRWTLFYDYANAKPLKLHTPGGV